MKNFQKVIKYLSLAFAIFLIFTIISSIVSVIFSFIDVDDNKKPLELLDVNVTSYLNIDVKSVNIKILTGETLKAETNNKYINVKQDNNKLYITQKKHKWFNSDNGDLIIYVPDDFVFDEVIIKSGAGSINIDKINSEDISLELGAGKVSIKELIINNKTFIDGGAGALTIENGILNDLDLDMGIGKLSLTSKILGRNQIDCGIGEVNLNLIGNNADYKIKIDKGIGSFTIDNVDIEDDSYYGSGSSYIDIDGGIGSTKIRFIEN